MLDGGKGESCHWEGRRNLTCQDGRRISHAERAWVPMNYRLHSSMSLWWQSPMTLWAVTAGAQGSRGREPAPIWVPEKVCLGSSG